MNKEESMLQKRLVELSRLAYNRGIVIFSDFLNLNELNILHTTPKDMFLSQYKTYGGYDLSERQMAVFLPDALYYDYEYPSDYRSHSVKQKICRRSYTQGLSWSTYESWHRALQSWRYYC